MVSRAIGVWIPKRGDTVDYIGQLHELVDEQVKKDRKVSRQGQLASERDIQLDQ